FLPWHHTHRQVLRESGGTETLGPAMQQYQERPARNFGPACPVTEPRRHSCALKRFLQQWLVASSVPQQNRHLVEGSSLSSQCQNTSGNLGRFECLAGSGKEIGLLRYR